MVQYCENSAQQCSEFGASAREGARHSGWKFSIPAAILSTIYSMRVLKSALQEMLQYEVQMPDAQLIDLLIDLEWPISLKGFSVAK